MRTIEELVDLNEPGWDLVSEWLKDAKNKYEILPKDDVNAERELLNVQVTTRSPMGAVIFETGGILIDHGWLRILGSGSEKLNRGLYSWNKGKTFENDGDFPTHFLIADDVIGGYFALNAGGVGEDMGKVYYLAPDTLAWENLDIGYSEFLRWTLTGDIKKFYELFRWNSWEADTREVHGNQVYNFTPNLWTKEGKNIEATDRKLVPIAENYALTMELMNQGRK